MATRIRFLVCCWLLIVPALAAQAKSSRVFIIEHPDLGRLCGYNNNDEWTKIPKRQDVEFVAIVDTAAGVISSVRIETYTEDFTTYDDYIIDKKGRIIELRRSLDAITDRIRRDQIWSIRDDRAIKSSESWKAFRTGEPIRPDSSLDFLVDYLVIVRLSEFPFYPLLLDKHPEKWAGGKKCVSGSMKKFNEPQPK